MCVFGLPVLSGPKFPTCHIPEMIQNVVELPMPRAYIMSLDPQNKSVSKNPMINIPAIRTIHVYK